MKITRCDGCMEVLHAGERVCPKCGYVQGVPPENSQYLNPRTVLAGTYELGRVLGAGGFGITYIGWDTRLDRKVAVKEFFPTGLASRIPGQTSITAFSGERGDIFRHGLESFREEARLLMKYAGNEGIVTVYDLIETGGTAYMVMEYVDGVTLKDSVERYGPMNEKALNDYIIPMLLSLKFVHQDGYIHRDIAPDNIMCLPDGTVKLLDFGAARYAVAERTQSLSVIAKQGYTPVEQYQRHGNQGPWTDIYAIGATMYKALTGVTPEGALDRLDNDTLKKPSELCGELSGPTEEAVMSALNLHEKDRPQTIDEFLEILTGQKKGVVVKRKKKSKAPLIAGIAAALAACAGLTLGVTSWLQRSVPVSVTTPDLYGLYKTEAQKTLEEKNLTMKASYGESLNDTVVRRLSEQYQLDEAVVLERIGEDYVIGQDPSANTPVEEKSRVNVTLSRGKEKYPIEDCSDMELENAEAIIRSMGFDDITIENEESDNLPGTVIRQNVGGEEVAADFDTPIVLTISAGREREPGDAEVTVEDYTGRDFRELKAELWEKEIYVVKSANVYSDTAPRGTVIDQEPQAGDNVHSGGVVYVVVSLGEEKASIPDVRYLPLEEAQQLLMERGLSWKVEYVDDPLVAEGRVVSQNIAGIDCATGKFTSFGTAVNLMVSGSGNPADVNPTGERIVLSMDAAEVELGGQITLTCEYEGSGSVVWSTSSPRLAGVSPDGNSAVVTGNAFGAVRIIASADGNTAFCTLYVRDAARITKLQDYEMEVGERQPLNASVPEALRSMVQWRSSSPATAEVDENGMVTAVAVGYATITATCRDQIVDCGISVTPRYLSVLKNLLTTKERAEAALSEAGVKYNLVEEFSDRYAAGIYITNYNGYTDNDRYYFLEGSTATLYVSLGKNEIADARLSKNPSKMSYRYGETMDYSGAEITVTYKDGSTKTQPLDLTSNTKLTQMPKQKVTFRWGDYSFTLEPEVRPIEVEKVTLSKSSLSMTVGDTASLSATVSPSDANDKSVTWTSSASSVVSVSGGKLTAKKAGRATVTAKSANGKTASCTVTVADVEPDSVRLSASELRLTKGETGKLTATVLPEAAADKSVTWTSSDQKTATVSNGTVKAVAKGTATITAKTSNGKTATCRVIVTENEPTSVTVSMPELWLTKGASYTLTAVVLPEKAENKTVSWTSSDQKTATVSNGTVKAVDKGTATITAKTSNGLTASCTVHVSDIVPTSVTVSMPEIWLTKGASYTLTATVLPDNAADKSVTWTSSNTAAATVSNGAVTAVSAGTAVVTAKTSNGLTASCTVHVSDIVPTSVTVSMPEIWLTKGASYTLTATVLPENAANRTVTWTSSNTAAATVSNGTVTAVSAGTAVVTAKTSNGLTASCTVHVNDIVPDSVKLSQNALWLTRGQTVSLTATVLPENAANKTVTWTSSNTAAATVSNGVVTAVATGTATVTATTSNGKTASCTVAVTSPAESVVLNKQQLALKVGASETLTASLKPDGADRTTMTWTSSNTAVAAVSNGVVTAKSAGSAVVTVTTANGKSASCTVTVTADTALTVSTPPNKTTYYIGDKIDLSGLTLSYTDAYGNVSRIGADSARISYSGDTYQAGTITVTAAYQDKSVQCAVLQVKKPYITLGKINVDEHTLVFAVNMEPAGQKYEVYSTNTQIFTVESYMGGASRRAVGVSSGTAYAYAVMTYNGIEYMSDSIPVTVEIIENYDFTIVQVEESNGNEPGGVFTVKTTIPSFDYEKVNWSLDSGTFSGNGWFDPPANYGYRDGAYFRVTANHQGLFVVYASYTYNGKVYEDSMSVEVKYSFSEPTTYTFKIEQLDNGWGEVYRFKAVCDYPQFNPLDVAWSVEFIGITGESWKDGDEFVVAMGNLLTDTPHCTVTASYSIGGNTLTATSEFDPID